MCLNVLLSFNHVNNGPDFSLKLGLNFTEFSNLMLGLTSWKQALYSLKYSYMYSAITLTVQLHLWSSYIYGPVTFMVQLHLWSSYIYNCNYIHCIYIYCGVAFTALVTYAVQLQLPSSIVFQKPDLNGTVESQIVSGLYYGRMFHIEDRSVRQTCSGISELSVLNSELKTRIKNN